MISALISGVVVTLSLGFIVGLYVGGAIERGGKTRREAREKRAIDAYLDRYGDMSTHELRQAIDAAQKSVQRSNQNGLTYGSNYARTEIVKMMRELDRRLSAGEVKDR